MKMSIEKSIQKLRDVHKQLDESEDEYKLNYYEDYEMKKLKQKLGKKKPRNKK